MRFGDTVHVTLGAVVHDTAKVTGGVAGFPVPAISFTFDAVVKVEIGRAHV